MILNTIFYYLKLYTANIMAPRYLSLIFFALVAEFAWADNRVSPVPSPVSLAAQVATPLATNKDVECPDAHGMTLLMIAAESGQTDALRDLLAKGARINAVDKLGCTALLHACWTDKTDAALALIDAGADCNLASKYGQSPLMYAANSGDKTLVKALLDRHVDVNANSNVGPALTWAVCSKPAPDKVEMVKLLLAAGADTELMSKHPTRKRIGETALGCAASRNFPDMITLLLDHGAAVDAHDSEGCTPLMGAIEWNNLSGVRALLAHGAQVNAVSPVDGSTALIVACKRSDVSADIVQALIDSGANVNLADKWGATPLAYAANIGDVDRIAFLRQHGAISAPSHILTAIWSTQPLTPARAWGLGAFALYTQKDGLNPNFLGGVGPDQVVDVDSEKDSLRTGWDIYNKGDLLHQLERLKNKGQRAGFLAVGQASADLPDFLFQLCTWNPFLTSQQVADLKAERDNYLKWKERTGLAWDLCRYIHVVSMGYSAGYLSESESWQLIQPVAVQLQGSFSSWAEMGRNFLDARKIWAGVDDDSFEACYQLLSNSQDPNSPWTRVPWKCDLSHMADTQTTSVP